MIKDFNKLWEETKEYFNEDHTGYNSGVSNLDKAFRLEKGDFVVLCGKPNDGKSTFIQWYLYKMSINNRWKTAYLNFEGNEPETFRQIALYYGDKEAMKNNVSFCAIDNLRTIEQVITEIKEAKEQCDIDCFVIDPYSNLLLGQVDTYTIAQDLAKLQEIGRSLKVTIILLCHPTKNAEEVNIYSIKGSSSFAERADVGLSLQRDYESNTITIKVDKLRANGLRGKVKTEAKLKYRNFQFEEIENNDFPFGKIKEKEENGNELCNKIFSNVVKRQEIPFNGLENMTVDYYATITEKTPQKALKLFESTLTKDSKAMEIIKSIRETENKAERTKLKTQLPCIMLSAKCGESKNEIMEYNNIICIDIDGQDNPNKTIKEMKDIVNSSPFVFYSAKSVSGKGLFALIYLDGGINDFKPHFNALEKYFKDKGLIIDKQCKNANRVRYVSQDNDPYINRHAQIYTDKINEMPKSVEKFVIPKITNLNKDKEEILKILERCKKENIIINPTHEETNKLSLIIAKYFGEDGFNIFMQFMRIKHKKLLDENKYYGTYLGDCNNENISLTIGTLKYLLNNAIKKDNI